MQLQWSNFMHSGDNHTVGESDEFGMGEILNPKTPSVAKERAVRTFVR